MPIIDHFPEGFVEVWVAVHSAEVVAQELPLLGFEAGAVCVGRWVGGWVD